MMRMDWMQGKDTVALRLIKAGADVRSVAYAVRACRAAANAHRANVSPLDIDAACSCSD